MTPVRLEPAPPRSPVEHSTTETLRSHFLRLGFLLDIIKDSSWYSLNSKKPSVSPKASSNLIVTSYLEFSIRCIFFTIVEGEMRLGLYYM